MQKKYAEDDCSKALLTNFYMDNLIITTNDLNKMENLYSESKQRMLEGNFEMKYNSNNQSLNDKLIANGDYVQHGSDKEKVLGYLYDPVDDTLSLKIDKINVNANTKREVLSEVSKVFDPLSLGLPVTIGGRVLLRDLWKQELGWDDKIPDLAREGWDRLSQDL